MSILRPTWRLHGGGRAGRCATAAASYMRWAFDDGVQDTDARMWGMGHPRRLESGAKGGLGAAEEEGEGLRVVSAQGCGGAEEGNLVVAPAASLRPSAERSPLVAQDAAR
jgi:hypothetical protein